MQYIPSLSPDQFREALRQTHELWGGGLSLEVREERQFARLASAGPKLYEPSGLITQSGALAGSLKKYYFPMQLAGVTIPAIGLGGIFTHPDHRTRGVASELIRAVLLEAREQRGCGVAVLYSDIDPRYYERFGFRSAPADSWSAPVASMPADPLFDLRPARDEDLPRLCERHRRLTSSVSVSTQRTEHSWKLFHGMNGVGTSQILLDRGEAVGYLSINDEVIRKGIWLEEAVAPGMPEERVWATIRALAMEMGADHVDGWRVPTHMLLPSFDGFGVKPRSRAIPMVAALDPSVILTSEMLAGSYFPPPDHF